jgi:hypothetical protein
MKERSKLYRVKNERKNYQVSKRLGQSMDRHEENKNEGANVT